MSAPGDVQRAEYEAAERAALANGRCVDSGSLLVKHDDGRSYCIAVCDCWGYTDAEIAEKTR